MRRAGDAERAASGSGFPPVPVPEGFRRLEGRSAFAVARADLAELLVAAGMLERGGVLAHVASEDSYQGRGSTAIVRIGGNALVVRRFLPGGLFRRFRASSFRSHERPFRELATYRYLLSSGVPTLEPVAAVARRRAARWILHLLTERLEPAEELLSILLAPGTTRRHRIAVVAAAGESVRRMHASGVFHADLHLKNLLWREGVVHVIDLDRAVREETLGRLARVRNLERLWRYAHRRLGTQESRLLRDALAFLRAYEGSRRERHELLRAVVRRYRSGLWRHRLGWFLERLFARTS